MQAKMDEKPIKSPRKPASKSKYISPNQLVLPGFETPYEQQLTKKNRWVKLAHLIPWDRIVNIYDGEFKSKEGRPSINGRIIIGSVIIKMMLDLTDEETINQICENMFMQYFIGYSSFTNEAPFDSSLFTDIRKRLNPTVVSEINMAILQAHSASVGIKMEEENEKENENKSDKEEARLDQTYTPKEPTPIEHKGRLLMDATVCPQAITYPTDLKLLDASRRKSEELIDKIYKSVKGIVKKPRTYREEARKKYLNAAKKKQISNKDLEKVIGEQLSYVYRNINSITRLINDCKLNGRRLKLKQKEYKYIETIGKVYEQQKQMYDNGTKTIEDRIVNIHQPYVRPIVRGKTGKKVEFGSKIQASTINGFVFIDKLSWDNFNEGKYLERSVENYKSRFGYYPKEVLGDQIYGNQANRNYLKSKGIIFKGKQLGRPPKDKAMSNHVSPGERNPIEGKFGQAKLGYGLERVRAKLQDTSESWISSIFLVLNLVKLMRLAPSCLYYWFIEFRQFLMGEKNSQQNFVFFPV
jgi:transposase, IS5 family